MSKIGQEALALANDDMGAPVQFEGHINEAGIYVPSEREEAEMQEAFRLLTLKEYTADELEAELDSRCTSTGKA